MASEYFVMFELSLTILNRDHQDTVNTKFSPFWLLLLRILILGVSQSEALEDKMVDMDVWTFEILISCNKNYLDN